MPDLSCKASVYPCPRRTRRVRLLGVNNGIRLIARDKALDESGCPTFVCHQGYDELKAELLERWKKGREEGVELEKLVCFCESGKGTLWWQSAGLGEGFADADSEIIFQGGIGGKSTESRMWVGMVECFRGGALRAGAGEIVSLFEFGLAKGERQGDFNIGYCELRVFLQRAQGSKGDGAVAVGYRCVWEAGVVEEGGFEGEYKAEGSKERSCQSLGVYYKTANQRFYQSLILARARVFLSGSSHQLHVLESIFQILIALLCSLLKVAEVVLELEKFIPLFLRQGIVLSS